jgi:hypothetical protein
VVGFAYQLSSQVRRNIQRDCHMVALTSRVYQWRVAGRSPFAK